jgi:hypothetical protein
MQASSGLGRMPELMENMKRGASCTDAAQLLYLGV